MIVTALPVASSARALRQGLLRFFLPSPCLACGETEAEGPLGLCTACRDTLVPVPADCCAGCGRSLAAAVLPPGYRCGRCRLRAPSFERLLVAWSYEGAAADLVKALKFRRLEYLGEALAEELFRRFGPELAGALEAVVPVPLAWQRRLVRGFNQAESIARPLARRLGLPLWLALGRRGGWRPQRTLGRSGRLRNLDGAFRCRRAVAGRRLLLVDDVATTGATLERAAAALRAGGAAAVIALAVARTPDERPATRRNLADRRRAE